VKPCLDTSGGGEAEPPASLHTKEDPAAEDSDLQDALALGAQGNFCREVRAGGTLSRDRPTSAPGRKMHAALYYTNAVRGLVGGVR